MPAPQPSRQLGTLFVLVAALLFGTTGTVLTRVPDGATALGVGAVRLAIGGPLLLVIVRRLGGTFVGARQMVWTSVLGGVGAAAFQLLYFVATTRTGVAVGTVVTIGSGPMFSGIVHAAFTHHRPPRAWLIGTALGIGGVCLLTLTGDVGQLDALGIVAALGSGLGWASFATLSKWQIGRGLDSTVSLGAMFSVAAVLTSPLLLLEPMTWLTDGRGLLIAVYLGVCTLTLAYVLYGRALSVLPAPSVITLTLLEPVTAAVLAAVVVGETIVALGWVGIALVLAGLLVTARGATVDPHDHHSPDRFAGDPSRQHPGGPPADVARHTRR